MVLKLSFSRFPHSDICGLSDICSSPQLFAACHVLLRLPVPRHPPCALFCLTSFLMYSVTLGSFFFNDYFLIRILIFQIPIFIHIYSINTYQNFSHWLFWFIVSLFLVSLIWFGFISYWYSSFFGFTFWLLLLGFLPSWYVFFLHISPRMSKHFFHVFIS